jgi:hypothetical protein
MSKKHRNNNNRRTRGPLVTTMLAASIRLEVMREQLRRHVVNQDVVIRPEKGDRFAPPEKLA